MRPKFTAALVALAAAVPATALAAAPALGKSLPAFVTHNTNETFTGHFTGAPLITLENEDSWDYAEGTISGEINTAGGELKEYEKEWPRLGSLEDKEVRNVNIVLKGSSYGGCNTGGYSSKELVFRKDLHGLLGYIAGTKEVALMLFSKGPIFTPSPLGTCFSSVLGENEYSGFLLLRFVAPGESGTTHELQSIGSRSETQHLSIGEENVVVQHFKLGVYNNYHWNASLSGGLQLETPYAMHIES